MTVVALQTVDTYDLRRRVLRGGDADASVEWDRDDDPSTLHLGIVRGDVPVAISTWIDHVDDSPRHGAITCQLRGMATEPALSGTGLGRLLLHEGILRARRRGVDLVWANARVGALGFYERAGFDLLGKEFTTPATGTVPHRRVELRLSAPPD